MKLPINYNAIEQWQRRQVREEYTRRQDGDCQHCNEPLDIDPPEKVMGLELDMSLFPEGFLNHPVHLHHDHDTGMTIGAVHNRCNAVLWQYHGE